MYSSEPSPLQVVEGIIQYDVSICTPVAEALNLEAIHISIS